MFEYPADMFHVGHLVADIESAMAELGSSFDLTWTQVVSRDDQRVWTPEHGQRTVPLTFCYSTQGPQHIELIQGVEGTPWWWGDIQNLHHAGVWCDVPTLTNDLIARGWTLVCSQVSPEEGYGSFSYVRSPSGLPPRAGDGQQSRSHAPMVRRRQPVLTSSRPAAGAHRRRIRDQRPCGRGG